VVGGWVKVDWAEIEWGGRGMLCGWAEREKVGRN